MLSISDPLIGIGKAEYYLNLAQEDYYLRGGEPPGIWHGGTSNLLGLRPTVEAKTFRNLLTGLSPDGKNPFVQNAGDPKRQSGWDFTFSAPKCVSVLWAMSRPEVRRKIEMAHQLAVKAALDYLEAAGGITRRGQGGKIREATPLLFAMFEHGTSREQDPQIHTHAVLFNLALRSDGTTGTLVTKKLFELKLTTGALYREELAKQLVQLLHLGIEFRANGIFHIMGVPQSLCDTFSKRRKQIEQIMKDLGLTSAIDAKEAAINTRRRKKLIPRKQLFEAWQEVGRQQGWSTPQVEQLLEQCKIQATAADTSRVNEPVREPTLERETHPASVPIRQDVSKATEAHAPADESTSRERVHKEKAASSEPHLRPIENSYGGQEQSVGAEQARKEEKTFKKVEPQAPQSEHRRIRRAAADNATGTTKFSTSAYTSGWTTREEKSFMGVVIRYRWAFPYAPWWSPVRNVVVPYLARKDSRRRRRYGKLHAQIKGPFHTIQLREKILFPGAPKWNPVHGLSLPSVVVFKNRRPPPQERIKPEHRSGGDKGIPTIPKSGLRVEPEKEIHR